MNEWVWASVECYWWGKRYCSETGPLCPSRISRGDEQGWTQARVTRGRHLTAWAMTLPFIHFLCASNNMMEMTWRSWVVQVPWLYDLLTPLDHQILNRFVPGEALPRRKAGQIMCGENYGCTQCPTVLNVFGCKCMWCVCSVNLLHTCAFAYDRMLLLCIRALLIVEFHDMGYSWEKFDLYNIAFGVLLFIFPAAKFAVTCSKRHRKSAFWMVLLWWNVVT